MKQALSMHLFLWAWIFNVGLLTTSEHRAFLTRAYPTMKKNNPYTPILIREALGVEPKIWARYEYGREKMEPLIGQSGCCTTGPRGKC